MSLSLKDDTIEYDKSRHQLKLKNVQLSYADTYTCVVSNIIGQTKATSRLTIVPESKFLNYM